MQTLGESLHGPVDLAAVRADDELLDAIAAGGVDGPTDPIDATLIQLLSLLVLYPATLAM